MAKVGLQPRRGGASTASVAGRGFVPRRRQDAGAILILALAFIVVIMVLTMALLQLAWTGSAVIQPMRAQRTLRYNAMSALQVGIQYTKMRPNQCHRAGACTTQSNFYNMVEDTAGGAVQPTLLPSVTNALRVVFTSQTVGLGTDPDGGQTRRSVTIEVYCDQVPSTRGTIGCASGTPRLVARAQVNFEINHNQFNYRADGTADTGRPLSPERRASVPKVVSWWVVS